MINTQLNKRNKKNLNVFRGKNKPLALLDYRDFNTMRFNSF